MDDSRQQAYLYLIQELLRCPYGSEQAILKDNRELLDAGLVQMMGQIAGALAERGNRNTAAYLISFALKLSEEQRLSSSTLLISPPPAFVYRLLFLLELMMATTESDGNPEVVYPLLQANLDKLDDIAATILRGWATATLAVVQPEEAQSIASYIGKLSALVAQFPQGIGANNQEIAITGYNVVLQVYKREVVPHEWAKIQNNLGIAYTNRIRGERAENIEQAIACCQAALQVLTREGFPQDWTMAQNNLANAYTNRIWGERAENIEQAIACCQAALQVYNRDVFPQEWAAVQHTLGSVYYERIQEKRTHNLEKAIAYYRAALEVRTRETFPQDWAMTQINLGTAYRDRIDGELAENLEAAIACYQAALEVYNRETFPQEWAMAQSNLGSAYTKRIRGERVENLEQGITCCQAALEVLNRKAFPQYWAMTQNNLGIAYWERIDGERDQNLEKTIACYQEALEVCTREAFPFDWAMIQHNLGIAYHDRIREEQAQNQEKAIACYQAALEVRTCEAFPQYWAMTQKSLGITYYDRVRGEKIQNLEKAIGCYQATLEIYTREAFPKNYAETQFHLGQAYQGSQQFAKSYTAFSAAINTVESLRDEMISGSGVEKDKQKLAEKYNQIYQGIVEICLELAIDEPQYYNYAIEYAERSKTRNLVELILSRDFHNLLPLEIARKLRKLEDEIAIGQDKIQTATADEPTALAQHLQQLRQQHNELQDRYLPIGYGFKFDQFQATLDDNTAVVEFYFTGDKLFTFIFTNKTQNPIVLQSEQQDLKHFEKWFNGYLRAYNNRKSHWQRRLSVRLHLLAKILHINEIIKQIPEECDRLILIPHRFLHLFPLHALPLSHNGKTDCLLDRFSNGVSYAPSCQLLLQAQQRKRPNFTHLFAIQNPTNDLAYTDLEVQAITDYFKPADIFKKTEATLTAINEAKLNTIHCAHFSCHGYFNLDNPRKSALILANAPLTTAPINPDTERYLNVRDGETHDLNQCLTLDAILSLNLEQCRLVTLSACETGLIDFKNISDEYIGIPSGFLIAGSPSVVSSLWRVNDLSTALLMIKFYQNLKSGSTVALALNQAQTWLRDATTVELQAWTKSLNLDENLIKPIRKKLSRRASHEQPFHSPYHWAAFCAIGQ
ncbi:MAG: CHAT domain-containing protein [Coleofasciculus sp. B1-GNL1-01]|uniref:CHAT domain-containing protein n=1 Tax=Coleofasciculus sp. B1-GNL1-01 TaxID=3068484 RepID=UPI003304B4D8